MKSRLIALPLVLALSSCTHTDGPLLGAGAGPTPGDASLLTPYGAPIPTGDAVGGAGTTGGGEALMSGAAPKAAAGTADRVAAPVAGDLVGGVAAPDQSGPLRAGSVDDNAHFSDYLDFLDRMRKAGITGDPLDVTHRHVVTVADKDGKPVLGATVTAGAQSARTHADGRALLFTTTGSVTVSLGDETVTKDLGDGDLRVTLAQSRPEAAPKLDLHFLIDTTGSMGDEIDRLRTTLDSIAKQIDALPQAPTVRYGLTVYRDHGDAYVSHTHDFTDLTTFRTELGRIAAGGGGDTPEALDEGFHGAVNGPSWDPTAVQLVFLVADASPHLEQGGSVDQGTSGVDQGTSGPSYATDVKVAQAKGIEVVPLAASGTDDPAELVFRELAEYTLGTFFFLTYGPDGTPGDSTDRHVSGYQAGSLDALVVAHVKARLDAYDGGQ
jgi:hypothetical protein